MFIIYLVIDDFFDEDFGYTRKKERFTSWILILKKNLENVMNFPSNNAGYPLR